MKRFWPLLAGAILLLATSAALPASPEDDREAFVQYYANKFPDVPVDDFINGAYSLDAQLREQWLDLEEFPPYELAVDQGQELFETPFSNGKTYADCFENGGIGIRHKYPYFDVGQGQVVTLELAINQCREANGEKPLKYRRGAIAELSAYMAYTTRGKKIDVAIPDDPRALAAYESGKRFYYTKRGQLNFSCADCHITAVGNRLRAELLSPALGQPSHFPMYRLQWGEVGTMHRRISGCLGQFRARAFKSQSEEYRNLEYFLTYMSNGLTVNGPGVRR